MRHDKKGWSTATTISLSIVLALMVLTAAPDALAQSGRAPNTNEKMAPMTGRIDSIGKENIIIDDASYKLSDQVSIERYKVGDRVTFIATYKYEILEIRHAKKKRQPKE